MALRSRRGVLKGQLKHNEQILKGLEDDITDLSEEKANVEAQSKELVAAKISIMEEIQEIMVSEFLINKNIWCAFLENCLKLHDFFVYSVKIF